MHITTSIETLDGEEVELTFIIEKEGEDEWSIDYQYIVVCEAGGSPMVRTWNQLNDLYDPAALVQAKHDALERAKDEWTPEEEFTDDDEGD